MSPKIRSILIIIGLLTLIVIGIIVIPRGLSLYYQTKGGQHVEYVLRSTEGIQELVCEQLSPSDKDGRSEVEQGIDDLERAIRFNKNNSQSYYYLGKANCLLGNPSDAKEDYSRYIELRPANPLGYIGLGFAYEQLNDMSSAKEAWTFAGLEPHDFTSIGDQEFMAKQYEYAITWYERSILIEPRSAGALLKLGKVYESLNQNYSAMDVYRQAWDIDSELSTSALIDAYKRVGEFDSVEHLLQLMLAEFSDSSERLLWFQELGSSYQSHGIYDQAVEIYLISVKEFPQYPDLRISLGWAVYERGDGFEAARDEFEKAIAIDDESGIGQYATGLLLVSEERYKESDEWFLAAIDRDPNNPWWYVAQAKAALRADNISQAKGILSDVIVQFPDYDPAYYEISIVLMQDQQPLKAIDAIETAIELMSSHKPWYFIRAGQIYERVNDIQAALRAYKRVLDFDPENVTALQSIERINPK